MVSTTFDVTPGWQRLLRRLCLTSTPVADDAPPPSDESSPARLPLQEQLQVQHRRNIPADRDPSSDTWAVTAFSPVASQPSLSFNRHIRRPADPLYAALYAAFRNHDISDAVFAAGSSWKDRHSSNAAVCDKNGGNYGYHGYSNNHSCRTSPLPHSPSPINVAQGRAILQRCATPAPWQHSSCDNFGTHPDLDLDRSTYLTDPMSHQNLHWEGPFREPGSASSDAYTPCDLEGLQGPQLASRRTSQNATRPPHPALAGADWNEDQMHGDLQWAGVLMHEAPQGSPSAHDRHRKQASSAISRLSGRQSCEAAASRRSSCYDTWQETNAQSSRQMALPGSVQPGPRKLAARSQRVNRHSIQLASTSAGRVAISNAPVSLPDMPSVAYSRWRGPSARRASASDKARSTSTPYPLPHAVAPYPASDLISNWKAATNAWGDKDRNPTSTGPNRRYAFPFTPTACTRHLLQRMSLFSEPPCRT